MNIEITTKLVKILRDHETDYRGDLFSKAADEIEHLQRELQEAQLKIVGLEAELRQWEPRAEAAEQKNAELVAQVAYIERVFKQILSNVHRHFSEYPESQKSGYLHALCDIADEGIANLPAEAEKVRKVVEAAKVHYKDSLEGEKNAAQTFGNFALKRHIAECEICQAVRTLNPEPPK